MDIREITKDIEKKLNIRISFCEKETEFSKKNTEMLTAGNTVFKFFYKDVIYVAGIEGTGEVENNYALLLPSYIDKYSAGKKEISKTEFLKKVLLGECTSSDVYKYAMKFAVKDAPCFAVAISVDQDNDEILSLLMQYSGNNIDIAVKTGEKDYALIKYIGKEEDEYRSGTDYADFLAVSLKEEMGITVTAGVGSTVAHFEEISSSYIQAITALRYTGVFGETGEVHSYKEYMLVKMLEDLPESIRNEYLNDLTDENSKEIFEDDEMLQTAEVFLKNSLNISETARKLYMHRNTLLYRLDKIEKATGLNIREFSDAVSFRVLTILYKLLNN